MRLLEQLYVTTHGCTSIEAARELVHMITPRLDELYDRSVISGYQLFVLKAAGDYEEYDLDTETIERETQGAFPAIFMNVTYRIDRGPPDVDALAPLIEQHAFRHLLTESAPRSQMDDRFHNPELPERM